MATFTVSHTSYGQENLPTLFQSIHPSILGSRNKSMLLSLITIEVKNLSGSHALLGKLETVQEHPPSNIVAPIHAIEIYNLGFEKKTHAKFGTQDC